MCFCLLLPISLTKLSLVWLYWITIPYEWMSSLSGFIGRTGIASVKRVCDTFQNPRWQLAWFAIIAHH